MSGPLEGVNILDVGTAGVGPWAATLLGYLGANVIKIEGPAGDRHVGALGAGGVMNGIPTVYTIAQLNKWTSSLDLKDPQYKESVDRLIQQADVVMDNLRPGVVDRLGFGYEAIRRQNPAIVSASSPAWGDQGPMSDVPGLDPEVQVFCGFASMNGELGGPPEMLRYPLLDFNASCFFASSILLALIGRERTGSSARVTCSHLGSNIALLVTRIAEFLATGVAPGPMGSACSSAAPHQYFRCSEGHYLAVGVETDEQWHRFCTALGKTDWLEDPRFTTNRLRVEHEVELGTIIQAEFGRFASRWWVILLEEAAIPHSYVYDFDSMLRFNQQIVENEYLVQVDVPHQGRMYLGGLPWVFERTPLIQNRFPPPAPGQYTDQVVRSGFGTLGAFVARPASASNDTSTLPLAGLKVIEVCQGVAGPLVGLLLAEAGAEVVKVEPPQGDFARRLAPRSTSSDDSAIFDQLNRNKRSITLDLSSESDRAALRGLASTADVFLEDWGPGMAEGLGLGCDMLSKSNPKLVYFALSGHGEKGPLRDTPACELSIQAWTGYSKQLGRLDQPPLRVGADIVGIGTGVMGFLGILAAIHHFLRKGSGQRVSSSMLGTAMCLRTAQWAAYSRPRDWSGVYCLNTLLPPQHGYQTKDRPIYWSLNNASEEQYLALLDRLGMLESVIEDPRFANGGRDSIGAGMYAHEVQDIWDHHLSKFSYQEALDIIHANGGMGAELLRLDELFHHPQVKTLELLENDKDGNAYLRAPWKSEWKRAPTVPPPRLGQHSDELLRTQGNDR